MLVRNPADAVEPPRVQHREMRTMNEADIHIFLEFAKSTSYYALFYLALFTGMRRSELPALRWCDVDLVFCHEDGRPLLPNSVSHAWTNLANRVGLKGIRLHDARHTHASLMLKQGIHPKIVQERLGHASIQITLDTYSHVAPGLQQAAANCFDDIVLTKHQDYSEKEVKEIVG